MPTYVYCCRDCGRQFEHFEKMTSRTKSRKCPTCGGRGERQISGGAGFLFKGEGFYITDYRSAEYKKKEQAESGPAGAPADAGKAEPAAGTATPGPEAVPDKTAARSTDAPKRRGSAKKKRR